MLANRSIPDAAIIPELAYPDVLEAAAWLCRAFGFAERLRIADHRVQLTFGGGAMVATQLDGAPSGERRTDHGVMVRVEDVDAHCARATAAGATILRPPTSHPFGERQYTAVDPGGHAWTFTQSIADVDPAEWGGELVGGGS
ncbi:MAG TPA: VOC family protein [Longimicrobiaceae bacterium]